MYADSEWEAALRAAGHVPVMYEGKIDMWAHDWEFHNGPMCETCWESWCEHCVTPASVKPCPGPDDV